jgi:hypothetical protein
LADVVITAASVLKQSTATTVAATAGAAITAGQTLYIDTADNDLMKLYDADSGTVAVRTLAGVALHAAATGQPIRYASAGPVTIGGTLAPGRVYVGSDTAGGIMPEEDLDIGDYCSILGYASSSSTLVIDITNTATAVDA